MSQNQSNVMFFIHDEFQKTTSLFVLATWLLSYNWMIHRTHACRYCNGCVNGKDCYSNRNDVQAWEGLKNVLTRSAQAHSHRKYWPCSFLQWDFWVSSITLIERATKVCYSMPPSMSIIFNCVIIVKVVDSLRLRLTVMIMLFLSSPSTLYSSASVQLLLN